MSSSQKDWLESVSEELELVVHDDPEVVEEPRLGFLLDHGREEAKLEAGHGRGTIDGEEVGFPALAHRDVLRLSFGGEALSVEERRPEPRHPQGGDGRSAPIVAGPDFPGLLVGQVEIRRDERDVSRESAVWRTNGSLG